MPTKHKIAVPAKASEVRTFLDGCRSRFVEDLGYVRKLLENLRQTDQRLACVYKVYSRGEKQGGEEMKHPRKVRLKFNSYNTQKGKTTASLYDVPDIVGLTVVVSYPSDISRVAEVVDGLIEGGQLDCSMPPSKTAGASGADEVRSLFGRVITTGGYFACHYNVAKPGVGPQPICEVQIKTVLHDAWGAKTHDLTYKPSNRTDRELLQSFQLLGTMLANLDKQSDTLTDSISRTAGVKERKRARVQAETLRASAHDGVGSLRDNGHPAAAQLEVLLTQIDGIVPGGAVQPETDQVARKLLSLFKHESPPGSQSIRRDICLLMCYLASKSNRRGDFRSAQDAIETWAEKGVDHSERLLAKSWGALAAFGAGDASEAIELGDEAVSFLDGLDDTLLGEPKLLRQAHSLFSSMSYYHADRVGSHEGALSDSATHASAFAARASEVRKRLNLPIGLESDDSDLAVALEDAKLGRAAFAALDTCAFVGIQLAANEEDLRWAWRRLGTLHAKKPAGLDPLASLLFDYHEYCARERLAELESG